MTSHISNSRFLCFSSSDLYIFIILRPNSLPSSGMSLSDVIYARPLYNDVIKMICFCSQVSVAKNVTNVPEGSFR